MTLINFAFALMLQLPPTPQLQAVQLTPDPCPTGDEISIQTPRSDVPTLIRFVSLSKCRILNRSTQLTPLPGREAVDFDASFVALDLTPCGGTFVGPRVFLTSDHCLISGLTLKIEVPGSSGTVAYTANCTRYSSYDPDTKQIEGDWALCLSDRPFRKTAETIENDIGLVTPQAALVLSGFHPTTRLFTVDDAAADAFGVHSKLIARGKTRIEDADSGSGTFVQTLTGRRLVAINWAKGGTSTTSVVSRVSHHAFRQFVDWWRKRVGNPSLEICGINYSGATCR